MAQRTKTAEETHRLVREAYGAVAKKESSCCGPTPCGGAEEVVSEGDLGLSCGDPVAFSQLAPGDVVLDLGSGAGKDVFLAARKVGASGKAIGVDMTDEMLALSRKNAEKFKTATGLSNVEFRKGQIESLPVEAGEVDIVISNCVINLSPDKAKAFREAFRALKPGGRLVVSDIVLDKPLPKDLEGDADLYTACISGALPRDEYLRAISGAGFQGTEILTGRGHDGGKAGGRLAGVASSITVLARKPGRPGADKR